MKHLILLTKDGCTMCDGLKPLAAKAGAVVENVEHDADALALAVIHDVEVFPTLLECEAPNQQEVLSRGTETKVYAGDEARKRLEELV